MNMRLEKMTTKKVKALPKQELDPERELPAPKWWEKTLEFFRRFFTKKNLNTARS